MKKLLLVAVLAVGVLLGGVAEEKKWTAQVGITDSWFIEQDVSPDEDTSDYIDDFGIGFKIQGHYHVNELFAVGVGFHNVAFDEDSWSDDESITDFEANATYISFEFSGNSKRMFEGYGSIEIGFSDLEDVDFNAPALGISGLNVYKGGSDTYYSIGGGVKYHFKDNMFIDLSYRFRDFGTLERNAANFTAGIEDVDVVTSSIDIAFGMKF